MSRIHRLTVVAFALIALLPVTSEAQERPPADTAQTQQQETVDMGQQMEQVQRMMPMMTEMMRQVTRSTMEALSDPETAQNLARFTRNYYNALVEQGFSEAQALTIVSNLGFPQIPSM